MKRCSICKKNVSDEESFCMDCMRKMVSRNYIIEYCPNCVEIICLSQQKVFTHKYIEYIGKCPKCRGENRS
jgi:hypothetical protein